MPTTSQIIITLDANESAKVKTAIPTSSNKIYYTAQARIYYAYASTRQWCYAGFLGALTFVLNTLSNMLHFKMVDLDGQEAWYGTMNDMMGWC